MHFEYNVEGGNFSRAGYASSEIKKLLKQLNVDMGIIKRTVVGCYEAEVNVVAHAYTGTIYVDLNTESITIRFQDEGPGIPDIDQAMVEGFSTASSKVREMGFGAGMGLPNIKKNADQMKISSIVGKGTTLEITMLLQ
ncbi:MAG: ATP-binding protein [Bacteroidales bacterium]|nr:ATP-binding protein [Bacteroidales bacterium]NLM91708.1 anti-sigma regulatory factor [Bacteroidales bacterium]